MTVERAASRGCGIGGQVSTAVVGRGSEIVVAGCIAAPFSELSTRRAETYIGPSPSFAVNGRHCRLRRSSMEAIELGPRLARPGT